jgi:nicotinamidase-related amidase
MEFQAEDLQASNSRAQLLLCMNLQKEHLAPGRRHMMAGTDEVLVACAAVMESWRARLWPIVHLKRIARAAWFNPASAMTDWIDAYRPRHGELVFEHPLPSAYSSARFAAYMAEIGSATRVVMIGFSLDESILATVIDGFHRGHSLRVVGDAMAGRQLDYCDLKTYRRMLFGLIADYAVLEPLSDTLDPTVAAQS